MALQNTGNVFAHEGVAKSTKLSVTRYMFTKHSPNLHKTYVKLTKNLYKTAVNKMVLLEVASIASVYTLTYFCLLGLTPNPVIRWWQCQGATAKYWTNLTQNIGRILAT